MSLIDRASTLVFGGLLLLSQPFTQKLYAEAAASDSARNIAHPLNDASTGVYEKVAPAVVVVDVEKSGRSANPGNPMDGFDFFFKGPRDESEQPDQSEGSGFIVRQDGYIVTNNHVIDGEDKINIKLKDGRTFSAKIVGSDERTDVAVLKIEATDLPTIDFANSD